ncbi:HET-domain-containing protein [Sarocladium strictum]
MRLINVHSYQLKDFFTEQLPKYAILSHTWGDGEVTYQDMTAAGATAQMKRGFKKIAYTCAQARKNGLEWAWVDTCCIDKTSSAELSEAINSMFAWYKTSARCYAYILDHHVGQTNTDFTKSRWFTRGWTLQELIAPETVDFYDGDWEHFGTKETLAASISAVTGITIDFLLHKKSLGEASIAQRMSWVASRQTTRTEDMSYCLLGIFDINMPLLYGEGSKAFYRLQTEIWREYDDDSLLAWTVPKDDPRVYMPGGVLASSPRDFEKPSTIVVSRKTLLGDASAMTKQGLKLQRPVFSFDLPLGSRFSETPVYRFPLRCHPQAHPERPISVVGVVNQMQDGAVACTRIATPEHCLKGDDGPISSIVPDLKTSYLVRAAPQALHDKFHALKEGVKIFIKLPWRYNSIEFRSSDLERYPSGRVKRDVEVLERIQADDTTTLRKENLLMALPNKDPHVFQVLLTVKERNYEEDDKPFQRILDLRSILQRGGDGSIRQAHVECKLVDNAKADVSTREPQEAEADEAAHEVPDRTGLCPKDLQAWAKQRLGELGGGSKLGEDGLVVEEDIGHGAIVRATLTRGSQDGIFGAMEHLRFRVEFSLKAEGT